VFVVTRNQRASVESRGPVVALTSLLFVVWPVLAIDVVSIVRFLHVIENAVSTYKRNVLHLQILDHLVGASRTKIFYDVQRLKHLSLSFRP
jgi:hypothetical protein